MPFKLKDMKDLSQEQYSSVWKNNGLFIDETSGESYPIEMEDALSHPNSTQFFQITIENLVREAIEPQLIGATLLERIQYKPGMQMSYGAIGAFVADDIDESGEYPEVSVNFGPGAQGITIGKAGIAMKFSDEWRRYSLYDQLGLYVKKMGQALARHKEKKIFSMLTRMGVVTHDNVAPSSSIFGNTNGYDVDGTANGSLTIDDIYQAYGQLLQNGFVPNALLVHPLTYTMFLTDPQLRAFALNHGGGSWFNGWSGNPLNSYPFDRGIMSKAGPGTSNQSNTVANLPEYNGQGAPKLPGYIGFPLQVIVCPYIPYNPVSKLANIFLVDTNNLGALIVDEEATMEEVPDRVRDLHFLKIRERYQVVPYNEGAAVGVFKNVKITPNKLVVPVQPTISTFTPITQSTSNQILNADGTKHSNG